MKTATPAVTAYIKQIDDQLTERLNAAGSLSESEYAKLLCKLVTSADTSMVPEADRKEMLDALSEYVNDKLHPTEASIVTIDGVTYAVTPELASNVLPPEHQGIVGDLFPPARQQIRDNLEAQFKPFLIRQIYSWLVGKAALGQTTTYEAIANEFGLPNKGNQLGRTLSPLLSSVYKFCEYAQQPFLTIIVVRKSGELKGLPGEGFWSLYNGASSPVLACMEIADRRDRTASLQAQVFEYWGHLGQ